MVFFRVLIGLFVLASCNSHKDITSNFKVKASAEHPGSEAKNLLDSDKSTAWNSGSNGQHWVEFALNESSNVSQIKLFFGGFPPSNFQYNVLVKTENSNNFEPVKVGTSYVRNLDSLTVPIDKSGVSNLRIVLNADSTWTNLVDIDILD